MFGHALVGLLHGDDRVRKDLADIRVDGLGGLTRHPVVQERSTLGAQQRDDVSKGPRSSGGARVTFRMTEANRPPVPGTRRACQQTCHTGLRRPAKLERTTAPKNTPPGSPTPRIAPLACPARTKCRPHPTAGRPSHLKPLDERIAHRKVNLGPPSAASSARNDQHGLTSLPARIRATNANAAATGRYARSPLGFRHRQPPETATTG